MAVVAAVVSLPNVARADDGSQRVEPPRVEQPASQMPRLPRSADFLFGAPRGWIGVRSSFLFPRAGGDLFSFVTSQLTLQRSDFNARGVATEVGVVLTPRFDLVAGIGLNRRETGSEYRHFIASNSQPITQRTRLNQTGFSVGLRFSPTGRGRSISHFAFIPRRVTPFFGGGAEVVYYDFWQRGQFVDYADFAVFEDRFASNGWGVGPYVNAGADVQVWKHLLITFDGRYSWLQSTLGEDFSGFDGIDLTGFKAGTGLSIIF